MTAYAGEISPQEAWDMLANDPKARLVDVRTEAEWSFVGIPDLSSLGKKPLFVEWTNFPKGELNPGFLDQVTKEAARTDTPLFFICRSGVRSKAAAIAVTAAGYSRCYNVTSGFEGDPDENVRRGTVAGWKFDGLPWVQG
jgi:rhodanese-related sulfurtransferase